MTQIAPLVDGGDGRRMCLADRGSPPAKMYQLVDLEVLRGGDGDLVAVAVGQERDLEPTSST